MTTNLVMTCYLNGKKDPQRPKFWDADDYTMMGPWHKSLSQFQIPGLIFHDCLSEEFVKKHTTPFITFKKIALCSGRSLNDERFFLYNDFLSGEVSELGYVLLTDLSDVDFFSDPFLLMGGSSFPNAKLFGCGKGFLIGDKREIYTQRKMLTSYAKVLYPENLCLNAGIIGGSKRHIQELIQAMLADFRTINPRENVNMGVYNKCAHELFHPDEILIGHPFSSRFNAFEKPGAFCIRHK